MAANRVTELAAAAEAKPSSLPPARSGKITKEALLAVALRQYQENGYEATSLRSITDELGITVAAMYYYFKSKDELLVAAVMRSLELLDGAHERISSGLSSAERLWAFSFLHTLLQRQDATGPSRPFGGSLLLRSVPADFGAPLRQKMSEIRDRLRNTILAGVRDKSFDKVDPTATTYAILGISHQLNAWYRPGGALSLDDIAALYGDFALRIAGATAVRNRARLKKLVHEALASAEAGAT